MRKRTAPDTPPPPKIPGVRHVRTTVYDVEATTVDGETTYRQVPRTVWVPAPPRDWDAVVARALVCAAVAGTLLSMAWSTDSIGNLLDRKGTSLIAYSVAGVFDVVWLACQAREWLERDDPARARAARRAGYAFLLVAMAAIYADGHEAGQYVAGAGGAAVSALAKFLWFLALGYYAVELDEGTAHHLRARRQKIAVRLAVRAHRRRADAAEAYERHVYGDQPDGGVTITRYAAGTPSPVAVPPASPAVPGVPPAPASAYLSAPAAAAPVPPPAAPVASPVSPAPPVPVVPAQSPVSPPVVPASSPVSPHPAPAQVVPDAPDGVPTMFGLPVDHPSGAPAASPAAPASPPGLPALQPRPHLRMVHPPSKQAYVEAAMKRTPGITLDQLLIQVRDTYGDKKDLRKDVYKMMKRAEKKAS